jgi:hypothetical protein
MRLKKREHGIISPRCVAGRIVHSADVKMKTEAKSMRGENL